MKYLKTFAVTLLLVVVSMTTTGQPAAAAGPNWLPTSDYCGQVWRDPTNTNHNGFDIWTSDPDVTATGFNGSHQGFPVQLVAPGILRQKIRFGTNGPYYGLRFYHPALNKTTFYWHMAPSDLSRSYVEETIFEGVTYRAGTFLGAQGDLTGTGSTVTHLHVTVADGDVSSDSGLPVGVSGGMGIEPSAFFGVNLNGQNGGACYGNNFANDGNAIRYQAHPTAAPMPSSIARYGGNYPNNTVSWYVIVSPPGTSFTRPEFSKLWVEPGFDQVNLYQFNTSNQTLTLVGSKSAHVVNNAGCPGNADIAANGRILFIQLVTDPSVTDVGFEVCNYHNF
jgi:hypothetical protein